MKKTLAELLKKEHSPKNVLETFKDYAESGAAISPVSIKAIVEKAGLSRTELEAAYEFMQEGMERQIELGQGIAGLGYFQAMNTLAQHIAETMNPNHVVTANGSLSALKVNLIMGHIHNSRALLEKAIEGFRKYAVETRPDEFGKEARSVNLILPGPKGIFKKGYTLGRYGDSISVYDYLMGIHVTDDLQIAEAPARR